MKLLVNSKEKKNHLKLSLTNQNSGYGEKRYLEVNLKSWWSEVHSGWISAHLCPVKDPEQLCCAFTSDWTLLECCTVALHGPEPAGARGLLQTSERLSTSCNRKCDHRGHPATDAKHKKKKRLGGWNVMWTVGFNYWTPQGWYWLPFNAFKGQGFV